ncbi:MAG: hypothetical protein Q4C49_03195 [Bacillota bacterium]|nr:hypothetical protein [Bacillota bacterium]
MKKVKSLFSLILSLAMCMSVVQMPVYAQDVRDDENSALETEPVM